MEDVKDGETGRAEEGVQEESPQPAPEPVAAEPQALTTDRLQAELEAANAKAAEYLDGWQRARAEFANYKKRVEREQAEAYQYAAAAVLTRFLPVLDDFELALKNISVNGADAQWVAGIELVRRKLTALLENEGIQRIEADGQPFDPNFHEAVAHEESEEHEEGRVIEVMRQGYKLGDRVLRPALVKVAK